MSIENSLLHSYIVCTPLRTTFVHDWPGPVGVSKHTAMHRPEGHECLINALLWSVMWQVENAIVEEPELICFKGTYKLASEPRGDARSAALAAAEMALVSCYTYCCVPDL